MVFGDCIFSGLARQDPEPQRDTSGVMDTEVVRLLEDMGWEFVPTGPDEWSWILDSDGRITGRHGDATWRRDVAAAQVQYESTLDVEGSRRAEPDDAAAEAEAIGFTPYEVAERRNISGDTLLREEQVRRPAGMNVSTGYQEEADRYVATIELKISGEWVRSHPLERDSRWQALSSDRMAVADKLRQLADLVQNLEEGRDLPVRVESPTGKPGRRAIDLGE